MLLQNQLRSFIESKQLLPLSWFCLELGDLPLFGTLLGPVKLIIILIILIIMTTIEPKNNNNKNKNNSK